MKGKAMGLFKSKGSRHHPSVEEVWSAGDIISMIQGSMPTDSWKETEQQQVSRPLHWIVIYCHQHHPNAPSVMFCWCHVVKNSILSIGFNMNVMSVDHSECMLSPGLFSHSPLALFKFASSPVSVILSAYPKLKHLLLSLHIIHCTPLPCDATSTLVSLTFKSLKFLILISWPKYINISSKSRCASN